MDLTRTIIAPRSLGAQRVLESRLGLLPLLILVAGAAGDTAARQGSAAVMQLIDNFAQLLGGLEGQDFQDEVCAFLVRCMADFQAVRAKPQGDAGLDGLSGGHTRAYCCYGPEQEPFKKKQSGLAKDIIRKFRGDLRKLFELESKRGKGLVHSPNTEIGTILRTGQKLRHIHLVVSIYESHRLLNPLNDSFAEYRAASQCRYIDTVATMTLWGPKEVASQGPVDDYAVYRIEERATIRRVSSVVASSPPAPAATTDFDSKLDWLLTNGSSKNAVERMRASFRRAWSVAIAIDQDFSNNAVSLNADRLASNRSR